MSLSPYPVMSPSLLQCRFYKHLLNLLLQDDDDELKSDVAVFKFAFLHNEKKLLPFFVCL